MGTLKPYSQRIKVAREKCRTPRCDGHVTTEVRPVLLTPEDRLEVYGEKLEREYPTTVKDAPPDAVLCKVGGGSPYIWEACQEGAEYAKVLGKPVAFEFNQHTVVCRPGDDPEVLWRAWWQQEFGCTYEQSMADR